MGMCQKRFTRLCSSLLLAAALGLSFLLLAPAVSPASADSPGVTVFTDTVTIPTYPCTTSAQFNATYGIDYPKYESCNMSSTQNTAYTRLNLENDYLRLSLLPELGGRVYELIFKPTGHNEFYQNPVIKPTPWGRAEQNYSWLAAGGLEWGLPLEEHGYEWGIAWNYTVVSNTTGVTVTLRDSAPDADRLRAIISVHLPADRALFQVSHRLENGRSIPLDFSYWTNAMLAPGAPNAPTGQLRFIIPTEQVQVHSRDPNDNFLPPDGGVLTWPTGPGRDMSRLGEWSGWFGFFAYPQSQADFTGVYDPSLDEGVIHVFPKEVVVGSKGFAFGWTNPIDWHNWTDNGSGYVELHNGPQPTFWDTTHLAAGTSLTYTDVWYPVSGLGTGLNTDTHFAAAQVAVLSLTPVASGFEIGLFSPTVQPNVRVVLRQLSDRALLDERAFAQLDPTAPRQWPVSAAGLTVAEVSLMVLAEDDTVLVAINPISEPPPDAIPPTSQMTPLPNYVEMSTFDVFWSGQDENSGLAGFDVQVRDGVDGAWTDWLTHTTALSATFTGQDAHTYFFRVRARDVAGNIEPFADESWGQSFTSVLLNPAPILVTSRKTAGVDRLMPGQTVTYTLVISNSGNLSANLVLTDTLPPDLTLLTATLTTSRPPAAVTAGQKILWQDSVAAGETVSLQYQMACLTITALPPQTNILWLNDGVHAPFSREQTVTPVLAVWLPLILKGG